jgi:hypothetical protein
MRVAHGIATALAERRMCRTASYNRLSRDRSSAAADAAGRIFCEQEAFAATVFKQQQIVTALQAR